MGILFSVIGKFEGRRRLSDCSSHTSRLISRRCSTHLKTVRNGSSRKRWVSAWSFPTCPTWSRGTSSSRSHRQSYPTSWRSRANASCWGRILRMLGWWATSSECSPTQGRSWWGCAWTRITRLLRDPSSTRSGPNLIVSKNLSETSHLHWDTWPMQTFGYRNSFTTLRRFTPTKKETIPFGQG